MIQTIKKSFWLLIIFTFLCGVIYPLTMTAIAQLFFSNTANGSIIIEEGKKIGSEKIGQSFQSETYFWGRPSITDYQFSAATNKSPTEESLLQKRKQLETVLEKTSSQKEIPIDLITFSASGLDPEITEQAAFYQVERIARSRGIEKERIEKLIQENLITIGPSRVNVLKLNLALDQLES